MKVKKTLLKSIQEIQEIIQEINSRSDISLAQLQKSGERLFDSLFVYENYPVQAGLGPDQSIKGQF